MVNSYDNTNNAEISAQSLNISDIVNGICLNNGNIQIQNAGSAAHAALPEYCSLQTGALKTVTEANKSTLPANYSVGDKYLEVILADTQNVRILVNLTELKNKNYISGTGIQIADNAISVSEDVVLKTDIADFITSESISDFITIDDISGKANVSLNNLNSEGKSKFVIKQYSLTESYAQNDFVASILDGEFVICKSLVNNNTGHALSNTVFWEKVELGGGGTSRNIGEIVQSTIPLTDAGLHLLDGALISGSGIYSDFVDYIAGLVTDYPDLFETEANWQSAVTTYGVCGKFVYNSTNNTVRLPKITGILEGTTDVTALGDLVEAGLPNITGTTNWIPRGHRDDTPTGAFTQEKSSSEWYGNRYDGSDYFTKYSFDASLSSSIYGNSTTVQPQTIKVLYYIVIATTTKTDIQVDIDEIATDINGKADVDLSNVPTSKGILTESYVNGTSWYRVYSDGWCEQGGSLGSSSYVDINLLKPFKDTNYTITACGGLSLYINTKTTSIIQIDNNYGTSTKYPLDWQACGYIR